MTFCHAVFCLSLVAACEAPPEAESVAASPEATALLADAQQRFTVAKVDYRSKGDPAALLARATHRAPVLASQINAPLRVTRGRIVRDGDAPLQLSSGLLAQAPVELREPGSGMQAAITLLDATAARAELVDGYVLYRGGHQSGAEVVHHLAAARHEDFLIFRGAPSDTTVRYRLELGAGVAGLRLIENTLELVDDGGVPRLRMDRPYTIDATDARRHASVAIEGCAYDQSPQAPFGRDVTPPGASVCTVAVAWDGAASAYPLLLDPAWTTAATMSEAREGHFMELLSTGDVLVAGGSDGTSILASAAVYSVSSNSWATTASMPDGGRYGGQVVKLGGAPIVIGGFRGTDTVTNVTAVERYNVGAGTWSTLTASITGRNGHTATVYTTGGVSQILVVGGYGTSQIQQTAERGTGSGSWTSFNYGNLAQRVTNHSATALNNGTVLIAGGFGGNVQQTYQTTCRLFNNATNGWSGTDALAVARKDHTATLLKDGRVLVAGGVGANAAILASGETYSTTNGRWSTVASSMSTARAGHAAVRLADTAGTVLLTGGIDNAGNVLSSAERFSPTTGFSAVSSAALSPRVFHSQVLLNDGTVEICGGLTLLTSGNPTVGCERFDPASP